MQYNSNDDDNNQVEAAIFVQCLNSCAEEVAWVSKLAEDHPVIKGIVGGLDLTQVRQGHCKPFAKVLFQL